jgi:hypothetical protein
MLNGIARAYSLVTGSSKSSSDVLDMSKYDRAIVSGHVCKASASIIATTVSATVSIYECVTSTNTGVNALLTQSTCDLNSGDMDSEVELEIAATEMTDGYRYIYAHVAVSTANTTVCTSVIVERGQGRYNPQD